MVTMRFFVLCLAYLAVSGLSFSNAPQSSRINKPLTALLQQHGDDVEVMAAVDDSTNTATRADFLQHTMLAAGGITSALLVGEQPASARGRATLEFAYEKYVPRIIAGGDFYKSKMKGMIGSSDFSGIKNALAEPPKKRYVEKV